jgi:predicted membrane-bound dolichyl-phosphate-mannose-protein mannosyltransferase
MGSPLAPIIYGLGYLIGGIFLSRIFAMFFIILSLILVYKLTIEIKGNTVISLFFAGFSSTTILLASDSLLDSIALFLFMISLFLINKKWFYGGIFAGLTVISKFFASVPVFFILVYLLLKKRDAWKFLSGLVIVLLIFAILYNQLLKTLLKFIIDEKISAIKFENLKNLFFYLIYFPPIISLICVLNLKNKVLKKHPIFFIPVIALFFFHILTANFQSFFRQLPFAEFPASILIGSILAKFDKRTLSLIVLVFLILNFYSASTFVFNYPSYNFIKDKLGDVNGRILALNLHAFTLAKSWDINATEDNIFSYYYYDYEYNTTTHDLISTIEDYETTLTNKFFDYALISSHSPLEYPRYVQIENLVRKYYCPYFKQNKSNGIDIYKRCVY